MLENQKSKKFKHIQKESLSESLSEIPSSEDFRKMVERAYKPKVGRPLKKKSSDKFFPVKLVDRAKKRESDIITNIFHGDEKSIKNVFDSEPDFVNEDGTKWWLNNFVSDWAWKKNMHGISLPEVGVWEVETKKGERSILFVNHKTNIIIREYSKIEDALYGVDMFKISKHFDEK